MAKHPSTTQKGQDAELIAQEYLRAQRYTILQTNMHTPHGEIDIVAKKNSEFICVEVRSRNTSTGIPSELTLTSQKYKRIILSILSIPWLENKPVRIDFLTIVNNTVARHYKDIRWDMVNSHKKLLYAF